MSRLAWPSVWETVCAFAVGTIATGCAGAMLYAAFADDGRATDRKERPDYTVSVADLRNGLEVSEKGAAERRELLSSTPISLNYSCEWRDGQVYFRSMRGDDFTARSTIAQQLIVKHLPSTARIGVNARQKELLRALGIVATARRD